MSFFIAATMDFSHMASYSAPLLSNILPHLQTLVNFVTNTLPKHVLVALLYRLVVLHFASQILPTIGADNWESEYGEDDGRPVSTFQPYMVKGHNFVQTSKLTHLLLTYRQAIFITVYSHLLRTFPSTQDFRR